MSNEPRAYTKEEVQQMVLNHVRQMVIYWDGIENKSTREKLSGLAFSILVMIDGESSLPAMNLSLCPHESDKQYHIDNDDNWFEPDMVINDDVMLHEIFYKDVE